MTGEKKRETTMRKFAVAAVMIVSTGPAYSQTPALEKGSKTPLQVQEEERKRLDKNIDKDYDAVMKRSRATTPNTASDPWHSLRSTNPNGSARGRTKEWHETGGQNAVRPDTLIPSPHLSTKPGQVQGTSRGGFQGVGLVWNKGLSCGGKLGLDKTGSKSGA